MKEVQHMLANLENEGVEIDGKIGSIIDDEVARIKAQVEREKNIKGLKRKGGMLILTISSVAFGFLLGIDWCEQALCAEVVKIILFG
ncbi:hypothetical protein HU200_043326 [Digitaria exilis]|uniref:Uncharacterized protein n=1 Tax=Digitaria exilis TaxID=1010633 RepID=A0A835B4E5_9POAL|nr:hypothetical protein HU200_043326 [Digitaria exilis]